MNKREETTRHTESPIGYFISAIIGVVFWSILFTTFNEELKELFNLIIK